MKIKIVMYHYIKDYDLLKNKGYKGLDIKKFINQINYLKKNYEIINIQSLFDQNFLKNKTNKTFCLLTFDDGYSDHYENVLPILVNNKISGSFFISGKVIQEKKALSVNKLHYILSKINPPEIIEIIKLFLLEYNFKITYDNLRKLIKNKSRFDCNEVNFIKTIFQIYLNPRLQNKLHDIFFLKILKENEKEVFKNFYLDKKKIFEMKKQGMYFGGHGYDHQRIGLLSEKEQSIEINKTINFLNEINTNTNKWVMCYPYGSYNNSLIKKLKAKNCCIGLTTIPRTANTERDDHLILPRLDANDICNY